MKRLAIAWLLVMQMVFLAAPLAATEKWPGTDEAVVQKIAREHGREPRKPLINTGEGDLQLFVFLMAGAIGGFAVGYFWRALLDGKKKDDR